MDRFEEEKQARRKSGEVFNSIAEKIKSKNQDQAHNFKQEGVGPDTRGKPC